MRYFFDNINKYLNQLVIKQGFMVYFEKMFFYDISGKDSDFIIIYQK